MFKNREKGITLIALVITIIILLILAGISISALTNQGLFKNAKEAKNATEKAEIEQGKLLNEYEDELNNYIGNKEKSKITTVEEAIKYNDVLNIKDNTELKDAKENKIVIPAGFKIIDGATTVDEGIVIEDVTENETKGNQFVWIPVGNIVKKDGTKATVTLGRYDFDSVTGTESVYSGSNIEEDANQTSTLKKYGNTIAKNITNFKNSVTVNGGYYIGRYEARKEATSGRITEVQSDEIWNNIVQPDAATQAQNMYNSEKFMSDLMNSYAWDTTIVFIQNCGSNAKYSLQNSLNTTLAQTGTTIDVQCNIYDISSNLMEWTTETYDNSKGACVARGGGYDRGSYTSYRSSASTPDTSAYLGFRPILYLQN